METVKAESCRHLLSGFWQAVVRDVGGRQTEAVARLPRLPQVRRLPPPASPGARPAAHAHPCLRPEVSEL